MPKPILTDAKNKLEVWYKLRQEAVNAERAAKEAYDEVKKAVVIELEKAPKVMYFYTFPPSLSRPGNPNRGQILKEAFGQLGKVKEIIFPSASGPSGDGMAIFETWTTNEDTLVSIFDSHNSVANLELDCADIIKKYDTSDKFFGTLITTKKLAAFVRCYRSRVEANKQESLISSDNSIRPATPAANVKKVGYSKHTGLPQSYQAEPETAKLKIFQPAPTQQQQQQDLATPSPRCGNTTIPNVP